MQLTRFSDISLRLLLYLACRDAASPTVTARATADIFAVPYTHMVKVVHLLGQHRIILTTKGKGGGLRLGRPASEIRVGDILRITEPNKAVIDCFTQPCPLRFDCLLKYALDDALEAFYQHLDKFTLSDLAKMPALKTLVQLSA